MKHLSESLKGKENVGNIVVDGRISLKLMLKKQCMEVRTSSDG
jgi:hypothetical protein